MVDWLTPTWVDSFWKEEKPRFDRIFAKINKLGQSKNMRQKLFDSVITDEVEKIRLFFDKPVADFDLLYRASENQFDLEKFYDVCSDIPHTLVLIHTEFGKVIGGYNDLTWKKPTNEEYVADKSKKCFIFSVTNDEKYPLIREGDAIKYQSSWGPIFGGSNGWDISIPDINKNTNGGIFNFPASYNNGKYSSNQSGHQALSGVESGYYAHIK